MTKDQTKAAAEVMLAFAAGKAVQCRSNGVIWEDLATTSPSWDWVDAEYRIKPEPREWHLNTINGRCLARVNVVDGQKFTSEWVVVREVL